MGVGVLYPSVLSALRIGSIKFKSLNNNVIWFNMWTLETDQVLYSLPKMTWWTLIRKDNWPVERVYECCEGKESFFNGSLGTVKTKAIYVFRTSPINVSRSGWGDLLQLASHHRLAKRTGMIDFHEIGLTNSLYIIPFPCGRRWWGETKL
jgi:hypothetical protein